MSTFTCNFQLFCKGTQKFPLTIGIQENLGKCVSSGHKAGGQAGVHEQEAAVRACPPKLDRAAESGSHCEDDLRALERPGRRSKQLERTGWRPRPWQPPLEEAWWQWEGVCLKDTPALVHACVICIVAYFFFLYLTSKKLLKNPRLYGYQ
jgi:hypothetical protein